MRCPSFANSRVLSRGVEQKKKAGEYLALAWWERNQKNDW